MGIDEPSEMRSTLFVIAGMGSFMMGSFLLGNSNHSRRQQEVGVFLWGITAGLILARIILAY